jgi:NAD(P)H-quinone oxidoreductase subunit 5
MGTVVAVMTGTGAVAGHSDPTLAPLAVLLCLSLSPVVARGVSAGWSAAIGTVLRGVGVTALYFGWHAAGARMLPSAPDSVSSLGWIFVVSGFALLFALQALLQARPAGRLARALQPRLFAGLYLDEVFTRMTFRVWPPRFNPAPAPIDRINVAKVLEVRT